jgi:predicted  nucleic acid-binding Zn-ribbon protein
MLSQQQELLDDEHRDLERRLREIQDRRSNLNKEEEALNKQRDQNNREKKRLWNEASATEQAIKNAVVSDPVFRAVYEYGLEEGKRGRS